MTDFALRVEELLEEQHKKKFSLVKELGIPDSTVRGWWGGSRMPAADTAVKVAQYLGTTVEYLITGEKDEPLELPDPHSLEAFTPDLWQLIDDYSSLDDRDKEAVRTMCRSLLCRYLDQGESLSNA